MSERRLIFTDALLADSRVPDVEKLVLGCILGWPGFPEYRPSRDQINRVLPFLDHEAISNAMHTLERRNIAKWDWRPCKSRTQEGQPPRLVWLAAHADPKKTKRVVHVPADPLRRLRGKGRKQAALLVALIHGEQKRRCGAAQLTEEVAAWRLGWSDRQTVKRAKPHLLNGDAPILRQAQRGGRHQGGAVYVMDEALPGAAPNLDPETGFDPEKTPTLHTFSLDGETTITIYATDGEAEAIETRLDVASSNAVEDVRAVAVAARERNPELPFIHAHELLDSALHGRPRVHQERRGDNLNGRIIGRQWSDSPASVVAFPNREVLPLVPLETLKTTSCARAISNDQEPRSEERPDDDSAANASLKGENPAMREGEQGWSEELPRSYATLASIFGERLPKPIRRELDHLRAVLDEKYGGISEQQLASVDEALDRTIRSSAASDRRTPARERYGPTILAIRQVKTGDDELHERLKTASAANNVTGSADRTLDIEAELVDLLADEMDLKTTALSEKPGPGLDRDTYGATERLLRPSGTSRTVDLLARR